MSSLGLDRLNQYAEDSAHTTGDEGQYVLAVTQDTLASSAADGDYSSFKVNAKGELYTIDTDGNALLTTIDADTGAIATSVASIDVDTTTIAGDTTSMDATLTALSKAEDSVHGSGDQGIMGLAVRNDAMTALAADGDYIPLTTDSNGALFVSASFSVPNAEITSAAFTVGTSEVALPTTPVAGRDEVTIQNRGPNPIFIGPTGVTTSTGLEIGKRSNMTLNLGPSVDVFGISAVAGNNVRVFEIA